LDVGKITVFSVIEHAGVGGLWCDHSGSPKGV
jgi:hypothetical protein